MFNFAYQDINIVGRVQIPCRYQDKLMTAGTNTIVVFQVDTHLLVFTGYEWAKQLAELSSKSETHTTLRDIVRELVDKTHECPVVGGSFVLPAALRKSTGINGTAVILEKPDHFEIWPIYNPDTPVDTSPPSVSP